VSAEAIERFECFGCNCGVYVIGDGPAGRAERAAVRARARMFEWHAQFSRFLADSELSRLNRDPRHTVPASPLLVALAGAARSAGVRSGGLVDATLLGELERAGYDGELPAPLELQRALELAPERRPAGPSPGRGFALLHSDRDAGTITRPPGLMLDSGGLAKGLFADVLAATLAGHESFAIDCGGDLAVGGAGGLERSVEVQSPFDGGVLHTFPVRAGALATSGIGRRSWLGADALPAHHLLDPASGRPAFTGVVQATALAPSAVLAEIHAKAAVLSGPARAPEWLPWGGVLVLDDGSHRVLDVTGAVIEAAGS
jgi:FAD:protein FMN transferase